MCNRLGPAEALRIWEAATPGDGHTVASFIDGQLDVLSGVEKKTIAEYRRYLSRDIEIIRVGLAESWRRSLRVMFRQ